MKFRFSLSHSKPSFLAVNTETEGIRSCGLSRGVVTIQRENFNFRCILDRHSPSERFKEQWYLDSGWSSHMSGRKYWFVNINPSMKNIVKFSNDNTLEAEGVGDVLIMRKDGKRSVISNVLYIPGMKSNLLNIGQLVEKNYKVSIKDKIMRVLDSNGRLILRLQCLRIEPSRLS
ncbi:hypothetical protein KIW84_014722 [Lathyrus oleraceus]|uniref:Retrovirus-related Pol polyprotein from transposon TNT 1-94-like beta-barrel domain-containing protein n=1 Tax=Pisum sativum TaxID=3888 RepID=A0A9D5BNF5_PEA|nr:hypothetical protein KIW84_014722 [Pisum sativum]